MKTYLQFLAAIFFLSACSSINSGLNLEAGKQFRLGGNQKGAFTVLVKNTGKTPVTISEQPAVGPSVVLGVSQPGDKQTLSFARGSAAVVTNASNNPAKLKLRIRGSTNLSMGYSPNK